MSVHISSLHYQKYASQLVDSPTLIDSLNQNGLNDMDEIDDNI